ncbi:Small ribosomal subunit biogenesis GTPase RsgA OS=Lysinibacillus sphaericus OX=1421 GN=rsgA PE=3 SV=1 [Lysinibacillus sphaericus]
MNLTTLGFSTYFQEQYTAFKERTKLANCVPARVALEHKHSYRVLAEDGEWLATIAGHFALYLSLARENYPAVGDWVLVEKMAGEEKAIIHKLFTRKSVFSRKVAGLEIQRTNCSIQC